MDIDEWVFKPEREAKKFTRMLVVIFGIMFAAGIVGVLWISPLALAYDHGGTTAQAAAWAWFCFPPYLLVRWALRDDD
jgi:hypothetical protein